MIKFCRNCGKELAAAEDKVCKSCGANAVKATACCRYCGHPTNAEEPTCPHCGACIKPLPSNVRSLWEHPGLSVRMGRIVNLTIVALVVAAYIIFVMPPSVTKPVQSAANDAIKATTGYSALPLTSISAVPTRIPPYNPNPGNVWYFYPKDTTQLTIWAIFKNASSNTSAGVSGQVREVTANATYQSSNPGVATVTSGGEIHGIMVGTAVITVTYTAPPGSANMSDADAGKIPITVTFTVPVTVQANNNPAYNGTYWTYY